MDDDAFALWMLSREARALRSRLAQVKPFALHETMVPAAAVSRSAQAAIERYLAQGRRELRRAVDGYLHWLAVTARDRAVLPAEAQRRFTLLRLRFNAVLAQFDIFADVMTQRSEHDTGVWLSGLDALAADGLTLAKHYFDPPPVICYLERGGGAAIRRARTRLPGGGDNPVAVVRVPRERMVGSGVASSLLHEVGHQAAALLELVPSLRPVLRGMRTPTGPHRPAWCYWERCLGEIVSDFYSVARLGVASTLGLMGVVSLPRAFVFRIRLDDPHPAPWVRVRLSCAIGQALYPHPQWDRLARLWAALYPIDDVDRPTRAAIAALEDTMQAFVTLLVNHRPRRLRGGSLRETVADDSRQPIRLAALWRSWQGMAVRMRAASPSLTLAAMGQAKIDGMLTPERESRLLSELLTHWALQRALAPPSRRDRTEHWAA